MKKFLAVLLAMLMVIMSFSFCFAEEEGSNPLEGVEGFKPGYIDTNEDGEEEWHDAGRDESYCGYSDVKLSTGEDGFENYLEGVMYYIPRKEVTITSSQVETDEGIIINGFVSNEPIVVYVAIPEGSVIHEAGGFSVGTTNPAYMYPSDMPEEDRAEKDPYFYIATMNRCETTFEALLSDYPIKYDETNRAYIFQIGEFLNYYATCGNYFSADGNDGAFWYNLIPAGVAFDGYLALSIYYEQNFGEE